jgi:26S proteasome regulatory subunit N7
VRFVLPRASPVLIAHNSELSRFIASGRLHATIDKVHGIVETTRPAMKSAQTEAVLRKGDLLLNSVQRLSKVLY